MLLMASFLRWNLWFWNIPKKTSMEESISRNIGVFNSGIFQKFSQKPPWFLAKLQPPVLESHWGKFLGGFHV